MSLHFIHTSLLGNLMMGAGSCCLFLEGGRWLTPLPSLPPLNPLPVPPPKQKGYQSAPFSNWHHLHTHQDPELKCCIAIRQKLRYGRPCTRDVPGTHNWCLHSPTLLPFLQNSTDYLMLAHSCKYGVSCCFIGLTQSASQMAMPRNANPLPERSHVAAFSR